MRVHELISRLKQLDPMARVVIRDGNYYESLSVADDSMVYYVGDAEIRFRHDLANRGLLETMGYKPEDFATEGDGGTSCVVLR